MAASTTVLTLGVVIASYGRAADLRRCLGSLAAGTVVPDDVIVVARVDDAATRAVAVGAGAPVRVVAVDRPGTVAARNVGIEAAATDLIAFIDDDTAVRADWAARVVGHFAADARLGMLGGRDRCHDGERFDDREAAPVGRVQWFGRLIGNHHLGHGASRPVEWLKGANTIVRRAALGTLRFDPRLRGERAQPAEDVAFSLGFTRLARRGGWRVLYDPAVLLDHYASRRDETRHYVAGAATLDPDGYYDFCYNTVFAVCEHLPPLRRCAHAIWSVAIGIGLRPGLLQLVRLLPRDGAIAWRRFGIAQRAHFAASRDAWRGTAPPDGRRPSRNTAPARA